jgi:hypothetical protein
MHALYSFDFLTTISKQLRENLDALQITVLDSQSLTALNEFQNLHKKKKGVYVVHYQGSPKYVGKADHLANRLSQHFRKLEGRRNIDPQAIGYKCLILDNSMSTAANEDLLIAQYQSEVHDMWNGQGFGPNDPGKHRDTGTPSYFDREFPIRLDILLHEIPDRLPLGILARTMKRDLPYLFRYSLENRAEEIADISSVARTPDQLLQALINHLGEGWRGAILSYGLVLYHNRKIYPHGIHVDPADR